MTPQQLMFKLPHISGRGVVRLLSPCGQTCFQVVDPRQQRCMRLLVLGFEVSAQLGETRGFGLVRQFTLNLHLFGMPPCFH
ncbi:hypothetical protein D3C71_1999650 [compost metagenome]